MAVTPRGRLRIRGVVDGCPATVGQSEPSGSVRLLLPARSVVVGSASRFPSGISVNVRATLDDGQPLVAATSGQSRSSAAHQGHGGSGTQPVGRSASIGPSQRGRSSQSGRLVLAQGAGTSRRPSLQSVKWMDPFCQ